MAQGFPSLAVPFPGTSYNEYTQAVSSLTKDLSPIADTAATPGTDNPGNNYATNVYTSDAQYQPNGTITTEYAAAVEYFGVSGLRVYPVAGSDTSGQQAGRIVQEHCPVRYAVITWIAIANGGPPRAPSPTPSDANLILVSHTLGKSAPVPILSGALVKWILAGAYTYEMVTPGAVVRTFPGLGNSLVVNNPAWNQIAGNIFDGSLGL